MDSARPFCGLRGCNNFFVSSNDHWMKNIVFTFCNVDRKDRTVHKKVFHNTRLKHCGAVPSESLLFYDELLSLLWF